MSHFKGGLEIYFLNFFPMYFFQGHVSSASPILLTNMCVSVHTYMCVSVHTYMCVSVHTYIRINTKRTHRRGHNKKYVLIPEVNILGRKNTKRTQRRGRNVCDGWAN